MSERAPHPAHWWAAVPEEERPWWEILPQDAGPGEVILGPSSTILTQLLARALAPSLAAGDEVVVTNLDHESNVGPWRQLEERGVVIREWRFDRDTGLLRLADLEPRRGHLEDVGSAVRIEGALGVAQVAGEGLAVVAVADDADPRAGRHSPGHTPDVAAVATEGDVDALRSHALPV